MDMKALINQKLQEMTRRRSQLVRTWSPYINAVDSYLKEKQDRSLEEYDKYNIAQCLDNALLQSMENKHSKLFETTTADNVEFLGIQLPVIAALLPSLVLNDVAIVQALDRRQGAVFFLDVYYGTTKGSITAGDVMINAKTGHTGKNARANRRYAVTTVENESLSDDTMAGQVITGDFAYHPMEGSVVISYGNNDYDDSVNPGQLRTSSGTPVGWVRDNGTFSITIPTADGDPASAGSLTATYCYYYDTADDGSSLVPEVDIRMRAETLVAQDFPLRAKYSIGASFDLQKAHGMFVPLYSNVYRKAA